DSLDGAGSPRAIEVSTINWLSRSRRVPNDCHRGESLVIRPLVRFAARFMGLCLVALMGGAHSTGYAAPRAQTSPPLLVIVVIDQLSSDLFSQYRRHFS